MEGYAVPVLRMREDPPAGRDRRGIRRIGPHVSFNAAAIARAVTTKLSQGPQSATPAMITIAKRGKNNLPTTSRARDKKACDRRVMLRDFLPDDRAALRERQSKALTEIPNCAKRYTFCNELSGLSSGRARDSIEGPGRESLADSTEVSEAGVLARAHGFCVVAESITCACSTAPESSIPTRASKISAVK